MAKKKKVQPPLVKKDSKKNVPAKKTGKKKGK
jgi:hypothetical protein